MKLHGWGSLVVGMLLVQGCSSAPNGNVRTVGFDELPEADRAAFAAWKGSLIKSCDWAAAFPSMAEDHGSDSNRTTFVDGARLAALTENRSLLAGGAGE